MQYPDAIAANAYSKMLQVKTPDGGTENVIITRVDRSKVTLDANHPLAGKDLLFEITLKEIR